MTMPPTFPLWAVTLAVTTATISFGSIITYYAHRAANSRQSRSLQLFSYGFAAITGGLFLGAIGAVVLDAEGTLLVQALLVAPGFILLLGSLYGTPRVSRA